MLTQGTCDETNIYKCIDALNDSTIPVRFILSWTGRELGFAKSHNRGVAKGDAPYVLILNPDVFVEPDCIERAIECLLTRNANVVGANFGAPLWGVPDWTGAVRSYGLIPPFSCQWPHVMGAFMLLRREIWQSSSVRGFDERFSPLYYEDLDLCARIGDCWYCAEAKATHIGCATTDVMKWRRRYWHTKNRIKFVMKWAGKRAF